MFLLWGVVVVVAVWGRSWGAIASPLSLQLCACPLACAIDVVAPTCAHQTFQYATNTTQAANPRAVNWIGAVFGAVSNFSVAPVLSTAQTPNCTASWFEVWAANGTRLVAQTPLVLTEGGVCETRVPKLVYAQAGNTTTYLVVAGLGTATYGVDVFASPPVGEVLYAWTALETSEDGLVLEATITKVYNATGNECCPLPATLPVRTTTPACFPASPAVLIDPGTYEFPPLDAAACAHNTTTDADGNTVNGFVVEIAPNDTLAAETTGCPANAFFERPSSQNPKFGTQLVPAPATLSASVTAYGYEPGYAPLGSGSLRCYFSPAGFARAFVIVTALSRCATSFSSAALTLAGFSGVPAFVGTALTTGSCPGTVTTKWRVTDARRCLPTQPYACGWWPAFSARVTTVFDGVAHVVDPVTHVLASTCSAAGGEIPHRGCDASTLNDTQTGFGFQAPLAAIPVSVTHYSQASPLYLRLVPAFTTNTPGTNITVVIDTVVASWISTAQSASRNVTFSAANATHAPLFCRDGCGLRAGTACPSASLTTGDSFRFVPSQWGFPELWEGGNNATQGRWDFATSASVRLCPTATPTVPALVPATSQITSLGGIARQTPGCLPLVPNPSASLVVYATLPPRNTSQTDILIMGVLGAVFGTLVAIAAGVLITSYVNSHLPRTSHAHKHLVPDTSGGGSGGEGGEEKIE